MSSERDHKRDSATTDPPSGHAPRKSTPRPPDAVAVAVLALRSARRAARTAETSADHARAAAALASVARQLASLTTGRESASDASASDLIRDGAPVRGAADQASTPLAPSVPRIRVSSEPADGDRATLAEQARKPPWLRAVPPPAEHDDDARDDEPGAELGSSSGTGPTPG